MLHNSNLKIETSSSLVRNHSLLSGSSRPLERFRPVGPSPERFRHFRGFQALAVGIIYIATEAAWSEKQRVDFSSPSAIGPTAQRLRSAHATSLHLSASRVLTVASTRVQVSMWF